MSNSPENIIDTQTENVQQYEEKFNKYVKYFGLTPEDLQKSILDVGTARGDFILYLRQARGNKNAFGVERSEKFFTVERDGLFNENADDLHFDDETFDIITAKHVLPMDVQDIDHSKKMLDEMLRVLKTGGKFMADIFTPEIYTAFNKANIEQGMKDIDPKGFEKFQKKEDGVKGFMDYLETLKQDGHRVEMRDRPMGNGADPDCIMTIIKK
ncbi:MAG: class I SAM-dependent methyltransferase [Candidatus Taylorbacteria bacterium]